MNPELGVPASRDETRCTFLKQSALLTALALVPGQVVDTATGKRVRELPIMPDKLV